MAEATMARRKSRKQVPEPSGRRLALKASDAYIDWVEAGADHCRTDVSKLIDAALNHYLRAQGFMKPAPKRVP